jgi:hypothetical protein
MASRRTAAMLGLVVATGLAMSACAAPADEKKPTPSASGDSSTAPSPTVTPTDTPTTAAPAAWTDAELTASCTDLQTDWAEDEGYAPDDFEWASPASTQQNAGTWYVFLHGTFTTPEGDPAPAEFTCAVSGTPDAPVVTAVESK